MHNDFAARFTRPIVRRIRTRRLLRTVAIATVTLAACAAQAGLIDRLIDWWNTPSKQTSRPVTKTVRDVGGADG